MSFAENPYQVSPYGEIAARAATNERVDFIRKTYIHLLGAVLAFCGLEVLYFQSGIAEQLFDTLWGNGGKTWLLVLGAFMLVGWVADYWARSATSVALQYAGLGLYVLAESIVTAPMLYLASRFGGESVIPTAGIITLLMFGGLTAGVFITGHDFSYLKTALIVGSFAAFGFILCGILFGFQLGMVFSVALIVLACGYILYYTSNVLHHYRIGQHVAAALALFAAVALLFWYVLRLVMELQRR